MKTSLILLPLLLVSLAAAQTYRESALPVLVKSVENALKLQRPSGRFITSPADSAKTADDYIYYLTRLKAGYMNNQLYILPCAYLYTLQDPANPFYHDRRLIAAIEKGLEFLDTTLAYSFHVHRIGAFLSPAFEMVEKELSPAHRELFLKILRTGADEIASRTTKAVKHAGRYTTMDLGVNTNHFAIYLLNLMRAGKILGNAGWVELSKKHLRALAEVQQPEGYWNEWNGPTPSYNTVTVYAMNGYHAATRDEKALAALKKATAFQIWFSYPNGYKMEPMDGRVQMAWGTTLSGGGGFSHTPEGRRFARLQLEYKIKARPTRIFEGEDCANLVENLLFWEEGSEAPLPTEKPEYAYALKAPAGVRRAGPWLCAYSAIAHESWPENQFFLDRQVHFSLWHDSTGLVLIGPNSKNHQRGGTFYMNRNLDQVVGYLKSGSLKQDPERGDRLTGAYDGFASELNLKPAGPGVFEIEGRVKEGDNPKALFAPEFSMQLFLNLALSDTVETERGGRLALSGDYKEYPPSQVGHWIKKGRWKLEVPENTRFIFPFYAFNPYSMYGHSTKYYPEGVVAITFPDKDAVMKCRLLVE